MKRSFLAARPYVFGTISFALLVGIWQFLVSDGIVRKFLISSPHAVVVAMGHQAGNGELWRTLEPSGIEFAWALALSVAAGVVLGLVTGWWPRISLALGPLVWIGYSSPFIALGPVFILTFGLGKDSVIAIAFLNAVFVIMINTERGVRNVDAKLVQAARSFGAHELEIFWKIVLPASLPLVMAGVRNAIGRVLAGVVLGELFYGRGGVGYSLSYYQGIYRNDLMIGYILVIGLLGVILTQLALVLERRLDSWRMEPS
ncbi:MAG TPA: ABC transporter permease [Gaiellaceae bacterium]